MISDSPMFDRGIPSICYGLRGLDVLPDRSARHEIGSALRIVRRRRRQSGDGAGAGPRADERPRRPHQDSRASTTTWCRCGRKSARSSRSCRSTRRSTGRISARRKLFGETGYTTLERIWARPTFEVNGLLSGFTGEGAKTVIPAVGHGEGQHAAGAEPGSEEDRRSVRGVRQEGHAEDGRAEAHAHARRQAVDDGVRQPVRAGRRSRDREGLRPDVRSSIAKAARFRSSRRSRRSSGCRACCSASACPTRTRTRPTRSSISATSTTASSPRPFSMRKSVRFPDLGRSAGVLRAAPAAALRSVPVLRLGDPVA